MKSGSVQVITGGGKRSLGNPPNNISQSWAAIVTKKGFNSPIGVKIKSPTDGSDFTPPANVVVDVTTNDTVGIVTKIELYVNNELKKTANSSSYSFTLDNLQEGSYLIEAKAYDNLNRTGSDFIHIALYKYYTLTVSALNGSIIINPVKDKYSKGSVVTLTAKGSCEYRICVHGMEW